MNSMFRWQMPSPSPGSRDTSPPPNSLACSCPVLPPAFCTAPRRRPIASAPSRAPSSSGPAPSMKWFIPPVRVTGSKRQTTTPDPTIVFRIVASRVAYAWPMWIVTSARSTTSVPRAFWHVHPLVNSAAQILEAHPHPQQRLRVSKKQVAVRLQELHEPPDQLLLELSVEVDDD